MKTAIERPGYRTAADRRRLEPLRAAVNAWLREHGKLSQFGAAIRPDPDGPGLRLTVEPKNLAGQLRRRNPLICCAPDGGVTVLEPESRLDEVQRLMRRHLAGQTLEDDPPDP